MRRRYPSAIAEIHLRGVLALFLMLAVAALVAFVHPSLVAMGPVAFVPLIGGGFSPPIPSLLDAAVSSRAPATDTAKIDAAALSGAPAANSIADIIRSLELRALAGGASPNSMADKVTRILNLIPAIGVSSVQYGSITMPLGGASTGTATISSVDATKSVAIWLGTKTTNAGASAESNCYVLLTNGTTVTATNNGASTYTATVSFMVVQFTGAKSVQQGTITIANLATSVTATISSVTVGSSMCFFSGSSYSANDNNFGQWFGQVTLTNATTVTASRITGTNALICAYAVVAY